MGLAADDSFDPISGYDDLPGEQSSRPVLTVGDLADNSDLSDIGPLEDDDNDVDNEQPRACTARSGDRWLTSRPSVRDEPCKTSADVARERQQSGRSSGLDPTVRDGHLTLSPPALVRVAERVGASSRRTTC
jgi:hypothetical protein